MHLYEILSPYIKDEQHHQQRHIRKYHKQNRTRKNIDPKEQKGHHQASQELNVIDKAFYLIKMKTRFAFYRHYPTVVKAVRHHQLHRIAGARNDHWSFFAELINIMVIYNDPHLQQTK